MRLLIAGGGTGGHIYPALAVVDALRRRATDAEIRWLGGQRGLEARLVRDAGIPLRRLVVRSLRSADRDLHLVLDPLRLAASLPQALAILATDRPAAIFTTGGYAAIPVVLAARLLAIPVLLWEGNRRPGRSAGAISGLVQAVAVSFADTCRALAGRAACFETGTPIRDLAGADRAASRARLDVPAEASVVLVFGGSQAARRLNLAVSAALPELVERRVVIHVTGDDDYATALASREQLPATVRGRYRPVPYLREVMGDALASADLVVGRAGSSTLAEATALGLPLVVVPYPYAGGHQADNAASFADAGAAILVPDEAFDGRALVAATSVLDDPARVAAMRGASRRLGRPGAAGAVADLLLALARRGSLPTPAEIAWLSTGGEGRA
ncbi:MAG TPA: UDP-N-acetylglucosamine--N-acetylmuramyl-(pentapeptide) pyrophosphoryl-undecaprenol N-acetylglucosamine transferase [Candidatus Binatus sp.]|nr:UDP-N-acetylglucosamine--N-acetylmuramyl-(pentapeptide) pyrophosphoryl-undecaprenol N-acetylglucosamine transferase [Candidatus Binatus sp.]